MSTEEAQTLMQHGQQLKKSRGLLQGIRRLPARLLGGGNSGSASTPKAGEDSIGSQWVQFLMNDEQSSAGQENGLQQAAARVGDTEELPVSAPSA